MREIEKFMPQAKTEGIIVQELANETLVFDSGRNQAHCLNQMAAFVWNHCDGTSTVAEVINKYKQQSQEAIDEITIHYALRKLVKARLISVDAEWQPILTGISRRDVLRRVGVGAAIAIPAIVSIVAPMAAHAASCVPAAQCSAATVGQPCYTGGGTTDCQTKRCKQAGGTNNYTCS